MSEEHIHSKLQCILPERLNALISPYDGTLGEGMRYAIQGGGKRIRPMLVFYGAMAFGAEISDELVDIACAVELIHNYSLVHDDMPEMDNDDMRRGKPSVHKKYGAGMALLIGDALLTLAGKVLTGVKSECAKVIMSAAMDMVVGQGDEFCGAEDYLNMCSKKTGALIKGAFCAGAIYAGACGDALKAAEDYSSSLGMAFQLADDLLDGDGLVRIEGEEKTKALLLEYTNIAKEGAKHFANGDALIKLAEELFNRKS